LITTSNIIIKMSLSQHIVALPRELQREIKSHIGEISMAITRFAIFGTPIRWSEIIDMSAAYTSGIDFFVWVYYQRGHNNTNHFEAARFGNFAIIKFLVARNTYQRQIIYGLAAGGHLEILKWARSKGCLWDTTTCTYAAENNHLDVLQWLRSENCPWDSGACAAAAKHGHLTILKWLREHNCPWDWQTCTYAALNGHLAVLQYARSSDISEARCEWDSTVCNAAAKGGHLDILKWLKSQNCPWTNRTYRTAIEHGHSDIAEWLRFPDWSGNAGCPIE
jgi:hypothetical protein